MWGATLFFITIVFVTQTGREAAVEYISQILSQPCSPESLACMALGTAAALWVMCRRGPKPQAYWVLQVVHGETGPEASADPSAR
jgi:hypothetical protein